MSDPSVRARVVIEKDPMLSGNDDGIFRKWIGTYKQDSEIRNESRLAWSTRNDAFRTQTRMLVGMMRAEWNVVLRVTTALARNKCMLQLIFENARERGQRAPRDELRSRMLELFLVRTAVRRSRRVAFAASRRRDLEHAEAFVRWYEQGGHLRPSHRLVRGIDVDSSPIMSTQKLFKNRVDAGRQLASALAHFRGESPVVLGLPRGGVPVAYEIAKALDAPLDVCVVRKIGAPSHPEYGLGAVAEDGVLYLEESSLADLGLTEEDLRIDVARQRAEVEARTQRYRRGAPAAYVRDRTVIVVDDGVATGGTARAAIRTLRARGAGRIVLAVPVGAAETLRDLTSVADDIVCLAPRTHFHAVSPWYDDFSETTDEEVVGLLEKARNGEDAEPKQRASRHSERVAIPRERAVRLPIGAQSLDGTLTLVPNARGLVVFVHGSGSGRLSPRNMYVASELNRAGFATLLFDLLTHDEEIADIRTGHLRFDIPLLAGRLVAVTDLLRRAPETRALDIGYFGASTGAAAALVAASQRPDAVRAIVSRGGRPDLAEGVLSDVRAPTLLLVGSLDGEVLSLNRETLYFLACEKELEIVPNATHLFEEPGTLEHVARSAARWFLAHAGAHVLSSSATA